MPRSPFETRESGPAFGLSELELLGKRPRQEDAHGARRIETGSGPALLCAVADGHGAIGQEASAAAVRTLFEMALGEKRIDEDFLRRVFARAHEELAELGADGGTTLTAALVERGAILLAWVGNSQARVFSADDRTLHTLTLPHEFGSHAAERDRLTRERALIVDPSKPYRRTTRRGYIVGEAGGYIEVSRALGDENMGRHILHAPETKRAILTPEEKFLLIGTDGFWGALAHASRRHKIEALLASSQDPDEAISKIRRQLSVWSLDDNTTLQIVDLRRGKNADS